VIHTFNVHIGRKSGLSDPEGTTTAKALQDLGFTGVTHVSFGRVITIDVDADTEQLALGQVEDMCQKLLANPVMENFSIEVSP